MGRSRDPVLTRAVESGRIATPTCYRGRAASARPPPPAFSPRRSMRAAHQRQDQERRALHTSARRAPRSPPVCRWTWSRSRASNRASPTCRRCREKCASPRRRPLPRGHPRRGAQLSNDAFAATAQDAEEPPQHLVFIFATTDPQSCPIPSARAASDFDFARVPLRRVAERFRRFARARRGSDA